MPESLSLAEYEHEAYLLPEYSFRFKGELRMADFCGFQGGLFVAMHKAPLSRGMHIGRLLNWM